MATRGSVYQRCPPSTPTGGCPTRCRQHKWAYTVELPRVAGVRDQRTKSGFTTRAEAQRALTALLASVDTGTDVRTRQSVGEYLEEWLARKTAAGLKASTVRSYRLHLDQHLLPTLGKIKLADLRPQHIDRAYLAITKKSAARGRTLSPSTLNRIHATLRSALNSAVKRRELVHNPAAHVELPRPTKPQMRTWSATELRAFLTAIEGERLYPLYLLAGLVGLRRGELAGLRWQDLDLDSGTLNVVQQLVQVGHAVVEQSPKTASGTRVVHLDPVLVKAMRTWRARQSEERLAWGPAYQEGERLFTREDGSDLHPEAITKTFLRLVRRSGLRQIRLHDLRHTSATLAVSAGEDARLVMRRLGHSSIAVTVNMYTHDAPEPAREAAGRLAALVTG